MAKKKSLNSEDIATKAFKAKLIKSGMSEEDINESGIIKPNPQPKKTPKPQSTYQRAKNIITKAIKKYTSRKTPPTAPATKIKPIKPIAQTTRQPYQEYVPPVDLDKTEKSLVASGHDPNKIAAMKRSIINRRKLRNK